MTATHDPKDLRAAASFLRYTETRTWGILADRLEAWADDMERLAPLEAAVLDALNVKDLRAAAARVAGPTYRTGHIPEDFYVALGDRLLAAADALHALEAAG